VVLDLDSEGTLPRADKIIEQTRKTAAITSAGLTASEARTRTGIITVGVGIVALGLIFSWRIGHSITRPLNGLAGVMKQLAAGDTITHIQATNAHDEIGGMARTVIVFRDAIARAAANRFPKAARSSLQPPTQCRRSS
jgi:methyl-accepting chemotaxis protein